MRNYKVFLLLASLIVGYNAQNRTRLVNKVNMLEQQIHSERISRSNESAIIFQRLDEIKEKVDQSIVEYEKLCHADKVGETDKVISDDERNETSTDMADSSLTMDVMHLKRAFRNEKNLRANLSGSFSMLTNEIDLYEKLIADLKDESKVMHSMFQNQTVVNSKRDAEVQHLKRISNDLEETINQVEDVISNIENEHENYVKEIRKQDETIQQMKSTNTELQNKVGELSYDIQKINHESDNKENEIRQLKLTISELQETVNLMANDIKNVRDSIDNDAEKKNDKIDTKGHIFSSCTDALDNGHTKSGIYKITIDSTSDILEVFCDQETDGGGWLVFQRRKDGSENFYRGWEEYKRGFGNLQGEFWLGNEYLSVITAKGPNELRIDMEGFEGTKAYAQYQTFKINREIQKYSLEVGNYHGNGSDSLIKFHNGRLFSTYDSDNDVSDKSNCAKYYTGAWWYNACHASNLNGMYYTSQLCPAGKGINWYYLKNSNTFCLKFVEMKLRYSTVR